MSFSPPSPAGGASVRQQRVPSIPSAPPAEADHGYASTGGTAAYPAYPAYSSSPPRSPAQQPGAVLYSPSQPQHYTSLPRMTPPPQYQQQHQSQQQQQQQQDLAGPPVGYNPSGLASSFGAPPPPLSVSIAPPTSFVTQPPQYPTQQPPPPAPLNHGPSIYGGFAPVTPVVGAPPPPMAMLAGQGAAPTPSSVVALRFRCKNLKTADLFSESDPFIVVYLSDGSTNWRELGRTETVVNCADPTFTKVVEMDYFFEEVQRLRLEVFDRDSKSETLSAHDFLGCVEVTMSKLMSSEGQSLVLRLLQSPSRGSVHGLKGCVIIDAEEVAMCGDKVTLQLAADKVDNKDGWFGKSDPFLNIYRLKDAPASSGSVAAAAPSPSSSRSSSSSNWLHVWRSEVIHDNLNPRWRQTTLSVRTLCNGDLSCRLRIECMDWERSGRHQFIGECEMTAAELVSGERANTPLINAERQARKGKKYKNSGVLRVLSAHTFREHTFAEYLRGGCEISLIVGIDYTASNGSVQDPRGLHYMGGGSSPVGAYGYGHGLGPAAMQGMNEYQTAIAATGAILEPYDHDRRFPVYGFGALVNGTVNHCFPLTFDPTQPEVEGVSGIMHAYSNSFPYIQMHGPTYFAPLIRQAAAIAQSFSAASATPSPTGRKNLQYYVLLIITDGVIMDMDATIEEIVRASQLPLSIVIVGVGSADFSAMDALDADGKLLRSRSGQVATRDIVQFVPFNQFRNNAARLAKETLAEIPLQLTQHFRARGIKPNPPLQREHTEKLIQVATSAVATSPATQTHSQGGGV